MSDLYCSVQDVRNALTSDPERADTAAVMEDWQIADAISEAMTVVDMHVRPRYVIAFQDVVVEPEPADPDAPTDVTVAIAPVRWWTRSVAAYYATLTWRKSKDIAVDDPIRLRFANVMSMLTAVRDGSLDLFGFEPSSTSTSGVAVFNQYDQKLFGWGDVYPCLDDQGRYYGETIRSYVSRDHG